MIVSTMFDWFIGLVGNFMLLFPITVAEVPALIVVLIEILECEYISQ